MVTKLKNINRERIKIKRGMQQQIGVNLAIKQTLKEEVGKDESYAETLNRILTTNTQMAELLVTLIKNFQKTPNKMGEILKIIPQNLRNLYKAVVNERKSKKKPI